MADYVMVRGGREYKIHTIDCELEVGELFLGAIMVGSFESAKEIQMRQHQEHKDEMSKLIQKKGEILTGEKTGK